jgi:F-type H+-transporting ATPase subunit delta
MASFGGSVARRYARAIFDIGVAKGLYEAFATEIEALAAVYAASPDLRQALENPVFKLDQRQGILEKILPRVAPSREIRNFALLLLERRRIGSLPAIARAYRELVDDKLGRVRATVTSATPLDPATQTAVQRALERRTGKRVVLSASTDPNLIGGIVARVGDQVFDGSLRTRLDSLKSRLQS